MLRLREFRSTDGRQVHSLDRQALAGTGADAGPGPWDADLENIRGVYLESGGTFVVGLVGEQIVAMGALRCTEEGDAEIKRMRVHPGHQRRGYGQAVLAALERHARERGVQRLFLDTAQVLKGAQRLYEKHGYTRIGTGELAGIPCFFYEKWLQSRGT